MGKESRCGGLSPGLTSFKWAILGSYVVTVLVLVFSNKESPVISFGNVKKGWAETKYE